MANFLIWYKWTFRPKFNGWFFKLLYSGKKVKVGKNFRCDTFPELLITQSGKLIMGDNVIFRRNVEIRSHQNSKIIINSNIRIDRSVRLLATNNSIIEIKDGTRIGANTVVNGGDSVTIGEKTLISGFVVLQTSMHKFENKNNIQEQGYKHAPITLGKDVWLGANVVILPGCTLNKGCIVGSNAVVKNDVNSYEIVGGIPAVKIKER